jgi:carbamoyltransferase
MDSSKAYYYLVNFLPRRKRSKTFNYFEPAYTPFQSIHHHLSHASSAFFASPFKEAAVFVADGTGPFRRNLWASTSFWHGNGNQLKLLGIITGSYPCYQSVGHFYSAVGYYLGFGFYDSAKTMSLAAYGRDSKYYDEVRKLIYPERSYFEVDEKFIYSTVFVTFGGSFGWQDEENVIPGLQRKYENILGPMRRKTEPITEEHKNFAWAAQRRLEEVLLHLLNHLYDLTRIDRLCYAGGVALNCVANQRIAVDGPFKHIFIQPACADDGQALGKLLYRMSARFGLARKMKMRNVYFGPRYKKSQVLSAINAASNRIKCRRYDRRVLLRRVASLIKTGHIVGWFQGRSELGPRALGHRSILADPRNAEVKSILDNEIKHREWFRPYAPSILLEETRNYFYLDRPSPFMLFAAKVKEDVREKIPAVVHVDGTSRVQTVTKKDNGIYYDLIKEFRRQTSIPILLNTSFNDKGEPIVESPRNAIDSFLRMKLSYLILENYIIERR